MKNGYAFGPGNPHPLSQMWTELVWDGTCLYSRFRSEMIERDQGEIEVRRLLVPPTTTQNGGEKSIEYCQLKAAALAEEGQELFVAVVFAFHAGKAVVQIAAIEIAIDHLLDIGPPEPVLP